MKKCIKCKEFLDESNFHKNNSKKDGLTNMCKRCIAEYNKDWVSKNIKRVNWNQKKLKLNHAEKGLCRHCLEPIVNNSSMCEKHWFQDASSRHFKTTKYGVFLKNLWINQNKKCVYTEEVLHIGINMSLDHIISKYNNKELAFCLDNVQWITKDVNMMKNKYSHDEFINMCEMIYKKYRTPELQACGDERLLLSVKQEAHPIASGVGG
jgi:5-methylcytosine-specific restriction endonuclease McrA